jgi:hypothetical protein
VEAGVSDTGATTKVTDMLMEMRTDTRDPTRSDGGVAGDAVACGRAVAGAEELFRPRQVPGPMGTKLTLADLPAPDTRRWVVRRKAEVLAAINGGLLSAAEACARYRLSPEELDLWQQAVDRAGVPGLRVTRIQLYRDYDCRRPARSAPPQVKASGVAAFPV